MPLVSDRCICLRKTEYSESSQILTLIARTQGIVRVMAKGAHRRTKAGASRFDGGIDLLDLGHAVFSADPSRELALLTDWTLRMGIWNSAADCAAYIWRSMPPSWYPSCSRNTIPIRKSSIACTAF